MNMMETAAQAAELGTGGTSSELVHILPIGKIEGRDGRVFNLPNPMAVVEAFAANGADLAVDFEHQAVNAAEKSGPIPAAGWIKGLIAKADGIYAKIEWTERARAMIAAKEYRYISPVITYDKATRTISALTGAGLVHRPNLHLTALSSQDAPDRTEPSVDQEMAVSAILRMLGLSGDATATDVIAALLAQAMTKKNGGQDPSKFVEVSAVHAMLEEAAQSHALMSNTVKADRLARKVEDAVEKGFITPGMRQWAEALCSQSEAMFDDFCSKTGPTFAYLLKPPATPPAAALGKSSSHESDALAEALCAQLGIKPEALSR